MKIFFTESGLMAFHNIYCNIVWNPYLSGEFNVPIYTKNHSDTDCYRLGLAWGCRDMFGDIYPAGIKGTEGTSTQKVKVCVDGNRKKLSRGRCGGSAKPKHVTPTASSEQFACCQSKYYDIET